MRWSSSIGKKTEKSLEYEEEDKIYKNVLKTNVEPKLFNNQNNFHVHSNVELMDGHHLDIMCSYQ